MSKLAKALTAAAGNAGGTLGYVEDVFSTYLYTGTGTTVPTQSIDNGIDLDGEGGLVWIKNRQNQFYTHYLFDTERGVLNRLTTSSTGAESSLSGTVTSFNADGFTVGTRADVNEEDENFASWTFRKAEKFFDVVTYTGDGTTSNAIAHNLGATPACIIIKPLDTALFNDWRVWHKDLSTQQYQLKLNTADAEQLVGNFISQNDTTFTVGYPAANQSGINYVAYLFASDAGGFGDDGSESIIKCGSFVPSGGNAVIDVGFEPQWLLVKAAGTTSNWVLQDSMRGWPYDGNSKYLRPNLSNAEDDLGQYSLRNNGFIAAGQADVQYIYIAIRRPMKTPESGTEVFDLGENRTSIGYQTIGTIGPIDMCMSTQVPTPYPNYHWAFTNRLVGGDKFLASAYTQAEATAYQAYDTNTGVINGSWFTNGGLWYNFKRATGFFDVVAYTGDGTGATTGRDINHNLGVVPDLMIIKKRNNTREWRVGGPSVNFSSGDYEYNGSLNSDITFDGGNVGTAIIGGTFYYYRIPTIGHTATTFRVGYNSDVNASGDSYIAYLFATLAGVSKVGSYTGTGSNVDVDCGFSAGARFILIKRTDSTGDWYVWDSARGIVSGNDPYLLLNSTAAEVTSTDYIDPLASGFTVTSSAPAALNASGGTYIFLAIA